VIIITPCERKWSFQFSGGEILDTLSIMVASYCLIMAFTGSSSQTTVALIPTRIWLIITNTMPLFCSSGKLGFVFLYACMWGVSRLRIAALNDGYREAVHGSDDAALPQITCFRICAVCIVTNVPSLRATFSHIRCSSVFWRIEAAELQEGSEILWTTEAKVSDQQEHKGRHSAYAIIQRQICEEQWKKMYLI